MRNKDWKEGDTVEVEIEQKGDYLNFSMPKDEVSTKEFYELRSAVADLQDRVRELESKQVVDARSNFPITQAELEPDNDVPF